MHDTYTVHLSCPYLVTGTQRCPGAILLLVLN